MENNTNRLLGLSKGWLLTAYRGDRLIGAAKYRFDHRIIMECGELPRDTKTNTHKYNQNWYFCRLLTSSLLKRSLFKRFFPQHSITFCPWCGFTFLQRSKVQLSQFLVCSICQSWDSLGLFNKNARKKYIHVIRQPGGPYWEKLCPRSWVPPEVVCQGRYSRQRTQLFPTRTVLGWWITFLFFPLNFTESFPNEPEWFRAVITARSSINYL